MSNSTNTSPIILNYGFEKDWMVNDLQQEKAILENAHLLTTDHSITVEDFYNLASLFEEVRKNKAALIIMSPEISEEALCILEQNKNNNYLETIFIRSPLTDQENTKKIIAINNRYKGYRFLERLYPMNALDIGLTARVPYVEISKDKAIFSDSSSSFDYSSANKRTTEFKDWLGHPIGHDQSISLIRLLKDLTNFNKEISRVTDEYNTRNKIIEDEYNEALQEAQDHYDNKVADYRRDLNRKRSSYTNQLNDYVAGNNLEIMNLNFNYDEKLKELKNTRRYGSWIAKRKAEKQIQSLTEENYNKIGQLNKKNDDYRNSIYILREEARKDYNRQEAQAKAERNIEIVKAQESKEKELENNRSFLKTQISRINQKYANRINTEFYYELLRNYTNKLNRTRFDGNNFIIPEEVPEIILLGSINYPIPDSNSDNNMALETLKRQVTRLANDKSIVSLPYAQRITEGISLLIRYDESDRRQIQDLVQPLLLKLFLSLPPGKVEATMIDPLELGANFSDIPKLAISPNSSRIIDTRIWSKEKDIEYALANLRLRLENMTQAYGDDFESRLKKEPIKVLAITDFPVGFNDSALKDLRAIVRNSAKLGVFIIITVNESELSKLKEKQEALISEITSNIIETKANGTKLMLTNPDLEEAFIQLDPMSDILRNKDNILSEFSEAIDHSKVLVEPFSDMFKGDIYDSSTWFKGTPDEISVPIGIKGADNVVNMVLGRGGGSTEHHALVSGNTGAGKSTFLHTLIMSTLLSYKPEDVQMYLLDFKEGVEFKPYATFYLPSLKVVALNSEREFGLNVLKELNKELEKRGKLFFRNNVSDINDYNSMIAGKNPNTPKIPKLIMIFDEVQELFRSGAGNDSISNEALSYINRLVTQGRGMGIHVILASQDFSHAAGLEKYFSQMAVRIAVAGTEKGAASILDNSKDIKALQDQPTGAAIYNNRAGNESANNFFQISYLEDKNRQKLLKELDKYYSNQKNNYRDQKTRVLLTNTDDDIHNYFNEFLLNKKYRSISNTPDSIGLFLGQGFNQDNYFTINLDSYSGSNLLVVTRDEEVAQSIFDLSAISFLHENIESNIKSENTSVFIIDLSALEKDEEDLDFNFLKEEFNRHIKLAKLRELNRSIEEVYERLVKRAEGSENKSERILFMFFGINRARKLRPENIYDSEISDELNPVEMLREILLKGPKYGINSVVWSENISDLERILGNRYSRMFNKRIAFRLDKDVMDILVAETEDTSNGKTAVYFDIEEDIKNTHFRPYDIPSKQWLEKYARSYEEVVGEIN